MGVRGTLWRKRWDAESVRQSNGPLLAVRLPHDYKRRLNLAECKCRSVLDGGVAVGSAYHDKRVDSGRGERRGLAISNGGQVTVDDAVLTVTATAPITSISVVCPAAGDSLAWTGSLGAGSSLVIDSARRRLCGEVRLPTAGSAWRRRTRRTVGCRWQRA